MRFRVENSFKYLEKIQIKRGNQKEIAPCKKIYKTVVNYSFPVKL